MFKEVDVAVSDLAMTSQRATVVDFSIPYMTSHLVVLVKVRQIVYKYMA